jgi:hypothetical protein
VIASDVAFEPPTTPHSPFPIAVDDARDRVYIGNNFGSVYAMDQTAGTIEQVLEADDLKSEFAVGAVRDLTMGPDGFLYMTARGVVRGFDRVLRADPSDWSVSIFVEGIEDPGALAFDSEGNLFITTVGVNAEPAQGMIFKSPPEGGTVVPQEQWDCGDFEPQP